MLRDFLEPSPSPKEAWAAKPQGAEVLILLSWLLSLSPSACTMGRECWPPNSVVPGPGHLSVPVSFWSYLWNCGGLCNVGFLGKTSEPVLLAFSS